MNAPKPIDVESLKKVYLFASLTPAELKFLGGSIKRKQLFANEVVFREGDAATSLYIIESGNLRVVKTNPNGGDPIVLNYMGHGNVFGEIRYVAGGKRTASVMSLDQSFVLEITYDDLERMTQLNPQFGTKLFKSMAVFLAQKLKNTTDEMAGHKPEVKVATRKRNGDGGGQSGAGAGSSGEAVIELE